MVLEKIKKAFGFMTKKAKYKPKIPRSFYILLDQLYTTRKMIGEKSFYATLAKVIEVYWDPVIDGVAKETKIDKELVKKLIDKKLKNELVINFAKLCDYYFTWNDAVIDGDEEKQKVYAKKVEEQFNKLTDLQIELKDKGVMEVKRSVTKQK